MLYQFLLSSFVAFVLPLTILQIVVLPCKRLKLLEVFLKPMLQTFTTIGLHNSSKVGICHLTSITQTGGIILTSDREMHHNSNNILHIRPMPAQVDHISLHKSNNSSNFHSHNIHQLLLLQILSSHLGRS